MYDFKDPNLPKPGPEHDQPESEAAKDWNDAMADMPEMSDHEQRDTIEDQPEEIREDNSVEAMAARAEADGYEPRKIGEQSVLSVNQDGKVRIESEYRNIWDDLTAAEPEFYKDLGHQDFSVAIWDVCNTAMFTDLNPDSLFDDKNWGRTWEQCTKLYNLIQDPKYQERGQAFLKRLEDMGEAGEAIVDIFDTLSGSEDRQPTEPEAAPEVNNTAETYIELNHVYDEIMSQGMLDSDDLEDLAAAYEEISDYQDASERANSLRSMLDRLKAASQLFDD